jgi:hypothetical protein
VRDAAGHDRGGRQAVDARAVELDDAAPWPDQAADG